MSSPPVRESQHYSPALPYKRPDGHIRGQDVCSDSSSNSEPGSSKPTSPGQVAAAEQHQLPMIRPNLRTHPVHLLVCVSTRQRPRWQKDDWIVDIDCGH